MLDPETITIRDVDPWAAQKLREMAGRYRVRQAIVFDYAIARFVEDLESGRTTPPDHWEPVLERPEALR